MGNKLYVGNLPYSVRDSDLEQAFGQFGAVTSAKVMMERDTGRSKGFGFVEMASDPEAQAAAGLLIETAVARLTHHQVWNLLLEGGASNPESLGRQLLPLLNGSDLLGHYTTTPSGARMIAALSPVLSPSEHADLEQAILRAHDPLDPSSDRIQELVDTLLGQLDGSRVQGEVALARLTVLAKQGGPPPGPPNFDSGFRPNDVRERLAEGHATEDVDDPLIEAMERLRVDVMGTTSGATDDQRAARERLRESLPALYSIFVPEYSTVNGTILDEALTLMVNGAERLASEPNVLPGDDLGEMVLGILRAGLLSADDAGGSP